MFVVDGTNARTPVASMPGVDRLTVDQAVRDAERAAKLDIPCIALFPYTEPSLRGGTAPGAQPRQPRLPVNLRAIKKNFPTSACSATSLDPFTSHGHDGLMADGKIITTRPWRCWSGRRWCSEAGCDVIAPSDMMDGRVGAIAGAGRFRFCRRADHVLCAKYASAFYGRSATLSARRRLTGDKRTYRWTAQFRRSAARVGLDASPKVSTW
jgi:porphobilinogen synthase